MNSTNLFVGILAGTGWLCAQISLPPGRPVFYPPAASVSSFCVYDGVVYLATEGGIWRVSPDNRELAVQIVNEQLSAGPLVFLICEEYPHILAVHVSGRVDRMNLRTGTVQSFSLPGTGGGPLSEPDLTPVAGDFCESCGVGPVLGTRSGGFYLVRESGEIPVVEPFLRAPAFSSPEEFFLLPDSPWTLYLRTSDGNLLYIFPSENWRVPAVFSGVQIRQIHPMDSFLLVLTETGRLFLGKRESWQMFPDSVVFQKILGVYEREQMVFLLDSVFRVWTIHMRRVPPIVSLLTLTGFPRKIQPRDLWIGIRDSLYLWVEWGRGWHLFRIQRNSRAVYQVSLTPVTLLQPSPYLTSMGGDTLIALSREPPFVLHIYSRTRWSHVFLPDGWARAQISSVYSPKRSDVWIGTCSGMILVLSLKPSLRMDTLFLLPSLPAGTCITAWTQSFSGDTVWWIASGISSGFLCFTVDQEGSWTSPWCEPLSAGSSLTDLAYGPSGALWITRNRSPAVEVRHTRSGENRTFGSSSGQGNLPTSSAEVVVYSPWTGTVMVGTPAGGASLTCPSVFDYSCEFEHLFFAEGNFFLTQPNYELPVTEILALPDGSFLLGYGEMGAIIRIRNSPAIELQSIFSVEKGYLPAYRIDALEYLPASGELAVSTPAGITLLRLDVEEQQFETCRNIVVYPSPVFRSSGISLQFSGVPSGAVIRIETPGGTPVYEAVARGSGFQWNLRDHWGQLVPPGVYLAWVSGMVEGRRKTCLVKIAVR